VSDAWRKTFLAEERLAAAYLDTATACFDPLAARLAAQARAAAAPILVGVNGSQGSGKSTLCAYLCAALRERHGLRAIDLSLDDFYLTHGERAHLAASVHPLLCTRGVPGTHDVALLRSILAALRDGTEGVVRVPRFDKAQDDRYPVQAWTEVARPLDVVLLEGWCLGAEAVDARALEEPLNGLERDEDGDGIWRRYVNDALGQAFEPLYDGIDLWIMLAAPAFEQVLAWRSEQEEKLRERRGGLGAGLMDGAALQRFVAHFERVTRQCLETLPGRVDVLLQLDAQRNIIGARGLES